MSDKHKDYDPALLRAVGNMLAGDTGQAWKFDGLRETAVDAAIESALLARKKLRKLQKSEESDR